MKTDKLKNYILAIILCIILFFALFVPNIFNRIALAIILFIYMIITCHILKKKTTLSIYHKQATVLLFLLSVVYLMAFYLMGLYFGYYRATVKFSMWTVWNYIIPTTVIIISSEIIRKTLLVEKSKKSQILVFVSMVVIDLILYTNVYNITTFDDFVSVVSFTLFSSIACNLLYNYTVSRFGAKTVIIFRLVTILYVYIIPLIPNVYIFFRCFLRIIYPYIIYLLLEHNYSKENFVVSSKAKKKNFIALAILFIVMIIIIMLVSCKFKYGILIIASGSMTGTINKGDAVVFEAYTDQTIPEEEVIIFNKDDIKLVHRVVEIKLVNGERRYYTKGDANQQRDEGYITEKDIVGISKFRIAYIGYPTLWLRDIFKKA